MKPNHKSSLLLSFAALAAASSFSQAATIANWKEFASGTPTTTGITNPTTNSPTLGDNTNGNAQSKTLAGQFGTDVTLSVDQTLTISGSVILKGGNNVTYRFGAFNDGGNFNSSYDWAYGWFIEEGTVGLYESGASNVNFGSSIGATNTSATTSSSGAFDGATTTPINFSLQITRDSSTTADLYFTLTGGDGNYNRSYTLLNKTTSAFTYNAFTFVSGSNTSLDQAVFSNIAYSVIPEPRTALLGCIGILLLLRRRR